MRNYIFFGVVAAIIFYAYMHLSLQYLPDTKARGWVEELSLGIDKGVLGGQFSWTPPLPAEDITVPKLGISKNFTLTRQSGPGPFDKGDSRVIMYSVRFSKSDVATGASKELEYRLVMNDKGSYLFPDWKVTEFHPVGHKKRKRAA